MRKYFFFLAWVCSLYLSAQTQEMEQLQVNLEKLAQLKLMLSQARQGYLTLQKSYKALSDVAKGNYDLHKKYLEGLSEVSREVKHAPALKRIMDNGVFIQNAYQQWFAQMQSTGVFGTGELSGFQTHYQRISRALSEHLDQLSLLLTAGKLRMDDGERIAAIEMLAEKSDRQVAVFGKFIKEQGAVAAQRVQNQKDKQAILRLYGLH